MIPRLFALLAFVVALSAGHASAQVWTFEPVSSTVWIKGRTENVTWRNELEKGQGIETIDIELGTGSSNRVTILETIVRGLPWPATTNYIWNIPNATKYKQEGQVFCLHYVGRGRNLTSGGVETPKDTWSTWFSLVNTEETYSRFMNYPMPTTTTNRPTSTGDSVAATTTTSPPATGEKPQNSAGRRVEAFSAVLGLGMVMSVLLGLF